MTMVTPSQNAAGNTGQTQDDCQEWREQCEMLCASVWSLGSKLAEAEELLRDKPKSLAIADRLLEAKDAEIARLRSILSVYGIQASSG